MAKSMAALRSLLFILVLGGVSLLLLSNLTPRLALTLLGQGTLALPLGIWLLGAIALGVGLGLWFSLLFRWVAGPLPRVGIPGRRFSGDRFGQGSGQRWGRRGQAEEDGEDLDFDFVDAEADSYGQPYSPTYGREDRPRNPGQTSARDTSARDTSTRDTSARDTSPRRPDSVQAPLNPNPTWHEPESWDDWEDNPPRRPIHHSPSPLATDGPADRDFVTDDQPYARGGRDDPDDYGDRDARDDRDDDDDRDPVGRHPSSPSVSPRRDRRRELRIDPTAVYEANYRVIEPSGPPLPDLSIPSRDPSPRPNTRSDSRTGFSSDSGQPSGSDWDDDWDDQW